LCANRDGYGSPFLEENTLVKPGKVESGVGLLILFILCGIGAGVTIKQSRYDPNIFKVALSKDTPSSQTPDVAGTTPDLKEYLPEGMATLTPVETFGPETLSEKIDGKAELYLAAGFLSLRCQRFVEVGKPDRWLEFFVYDMGTMRNAYSVFSTQRRSDAQDATFTQFAYQTANAVFFLHGQYYLEVIAASDQMAETVLAVGDHFVRKNPQDTQDMAEVALFPKASLIPDSIALLAENVFGFSGLNNTFIARYALSDSELTAFLSHRQTFQEARDVALAYHQFLVENGGDEVAMDSVIPEARLVKIFDTFELVFVQGSYLAGVHEAESKELAEELALNLKNALAEAAP
jgi:hypothetical protein